MAADKLQIKQTILDGVQYGIKNVVPLILMVILYVVTIWIPWLNVGTTVGLYKSVIKIGRGEVINPVDIFAKENWQNLGDFFLLMGLMSIGITAACMFVFIPGIILSFAWSFALYFFIDKGLSPTKALKVSYKVTDGEKWTIFWIMLIVCVLGGIVCGLFAGLATIKYVGWLFAILCFAAYLITFAVLLAVDGVMYKYFSEKADKIFADKIGCCCKEEPKAPEAPVAPAAPEAPAE